jgi:hypothetical protein
LYTILILAFDKLSLFMMIAANWKYQRKILCFVLEG